MKNCRNFFPRNKQNHKAVKKKNEPFEVMKHSNWGGGRKRNEG